MSENLPPGAVPPPADQPPTWTAPTGSGTPDSQSGTQTGAPGVPTGDSGVPPRVSGTDGFFDSARRMGITRSDDRWIGGVAAGVADRFGIDPLIVRGVLFLTFFISGAGLLLYGIAWALLPERQDGRIHLQEALRGHFDSALAGAIVLVIIGSSWGNGWWSHWGRWWGGPFEWLSGLLWFAAVVTVVIVGINALSNRKKRAVGTAGPNPTGPHHGPAQPGPGHQGTTHHGSGHHGAAAQTPTYTGAPFTSAAPEATVPAATTDWTTSATAPLPTVATAPFDHAAATAYQAAPVSPTAGPQVQSPYLPKPRPQGPGRTMTSAVLGLALLAGAVLLLVHRTGSGSWPVALMWFGITVVIIGLGIVITGLRGRRSGVLGFLAITAMIASSPVFLWQVSNDVTGDHRDLVADGTPTVVTDPVTAAGGYSYGVGDARLDLTGLDLKGFTVEHPLVVPVQLGIGELTVLVPNDIGVSADVRTGIGVTRWDVSWSEDRSGTQANVLGNTSVNHSDPILVLDAEVGIGEFILKEQS